ELVLLVAIADAVGVSVEGDLHGNEGSYRDRAKPCNSFAGGADITSLSSWRRRLRSILLFGLRGTSSTKTHRAARLNLVACVARWRAGSSSVADCPGLNAPTATMFSP